MQMPKKKAIGAVACALAFAASAPGAGQAQTNDWENTEINSRNRMPAATYAMPLADEAAALSGDLEPATPYSMSLDGEWRFKWTGDPARRPLDFWKSGFDDSKWGTIDVPSCVELRGYGIPIYTNVRYPHKMAWPKILDRDTGRADYNPVSSYRRTFTLPASWDGRETILRFEGVGSAFYVWINGKEAGYAEDSKLPSEFNVTEFLKPGENLICVQVFKWCDGSYLEDQDMFRYSGIFRSVSLWSRPKAGIADFIVRTALDGAYENATLDLEVATYGNPGAVSATLHSPDGKVVAGAPAGDGKLRFDVKGVRLWSAEKPELYTLVVKAGGDIRSKRVGFKEQKISGNTILVNGRMVKFKGVNRHETNPDNGRTVTLDDMVKDIVLMKRYNINTVRTCHYPDHRLWYDLCDRYGIYVVAEANVEAHEPGYGNKGLGRFKEWEHSIVERNMRHVAFYRNNACVTLWSMGNETGHGDCFRKAIDMVHEADPSRPVHWERGNSDADVDSIMYPSVDWLESRGKLGDKPRGEEKMNERGRDQSSGKAFFMCEYAHAMGNAIGNFAEYWDVFYKYDSLTGGCIWDWVDQAVWKYTDRVDPETGARERYLAYGGDFDDDPNDGPFCVNGVVDPLRNVTPKLVEVGHVHRNLVVSRRKDGTFELWNRYGFTGASEFAGSWRIVSDGAETASGALAVPAVAPLSRGTIDDPALAKAVAALEPGKEHFVEFAFSTKKDFPWAKAGWTVARDQIALSAPVAAAPAAKDPSSRLGVDWTEKELIVEKDGTTAVFDRKSGAISRMTLKGGMNIFDNPAAGVPGGPQLTCARAFVDNDKWMAKGFFQQVLSQLRYHAEPLVVDGDTVKSVVDVTSGKGCGFLHECSYRFLPGGSVEVSNKVKPYGRMPDLPRLGATMRLPARFDTVRWYGRGPVENYIDRCTGSFVGIYSSKVKDLFVDYVRPQDNGYRSDVRWIEFTDKYGAGARFTGSVPLFAQALHYTWEDLHFAAFQRGENRHRVPLSPRSETVFNLDFRQTGLGGASCGPAPMGKYRFDPLKESSWSYRIDPVKPAKQK